MMNTNADFYFATLASENMETYIKTDLLFYPLSIISIDEMPALSIGTWLEITWRLNAAELSVNRRTKFSLLLSNVAEIRRQLNEPYLAKARREFRSRLDSWTWYLDDAQDGKNYVANIHHRLKIELLKDDVPQPDKELTRLAQCDARLKIKFKDNGFVYASYLEKAAPKGKFWWLYGSL
jgi:hypothetical protein